MSPKEYFMRATRSRGAAIALTGVLAVSLSACAGTESGTSGPVDLTMALWSSNEGHLALLQEIGDAYIEEHGDAVSYTHLTLPTTPYV